jgi:hypothetical protein
MVNKSRTKTNSIGSMVPKYTNTTNVTKLQLSMARQIIKKHSSLHY